MIGIIVRLGAIPEEERGRRGRRPGRMSRSDSPLFRGREKEGTGLEKASVSFPTAAASRRRAAKAGEGEILPRTGRCLGARHSCYTTADCHREALTGSVCMYIARRWAERDEYFHNREIWSVCFLVEIHLIIFIIIVNTTPMPVYPHHTIRNPDKHGTHLHPHALYNNRCCRPPSNTQMRAPRAGI